MKQDFVIRRAEIGDVIGLAPLYDAYRQFYGCPTDYERARSFLADRFAEKSSIVFVAEDTAGQAVGFAQLYPTFCSVEAFPILVLYDLFVVSDRRGGGIGNGLLNTVFVYAKDGNFGRVDLRTAVTNEGAQRLYEANGWERVEWLYDYSRHVT